MLPEPAARAIAARVFAHARKLPGATAELTLGSVRTSYTRFAVDTVTAAATAEDVSVSIAIGFGAQVASATTNQLDDAALGDAVARAARLARLVPADPEAMPPLGAQRYGRGPVPDAATAHADAAARAAIAGAVLARGRDHGVTMAGFVEHAHSSFTLASSAGLWAHHVATTARASCSARTTDATGSGWASAVSHRLADLDGAALGATAVDKATRSARPRALEPGRYTVVLEPAATAALVSFVIGSLDAREADEGRSCWSRPGGTAIGEKLFPDTITYRSDPTDAAVGGQPFDGQGLPTPARRWIDRGTLTALPVGRYWAKHKGVAPIAFGSGWTMEGGTATRDQLLAGVKRGVLISRFWYLGLIDPQTLTATGLTRDGVFLIEDGAIAGPVNNFRFNQSVLDVLRRCDALGASAITDVDSGFPFRAPWLRTHDFNLASVSEAI